MPKIKMLSRNPDDYLRETKKDIHKVPRNYDPVLHPFEAQREYTRAMNATKLERVFAKPFLGSLDGHRDGVNCLIKHPTSLSHMLSGSCDGEVRMWNLAKKECVRTWTAHNGLVHGMSYHPSGEYFFTCGNDCTIKQWKMESAGEEADDEPVNTIIVKSVPHNIDHHWKENQFVTCGQEVAVWDESRAEPMRTFSWGVDSVHAVKFNPIETSLIGACASDRSVLLYDMRESVPLRKVILKLKSNNMAWNPMEAYVFTVANEDYNLYSFDMRKMSMPFNVHMDHVSAVLDLDYSPTGKEFVSGSYDKTLRIFKLNGKCREVYHTKRMQRVQCVRWSTDNKYILSASDEMNLRIWKANASEKLGVLKPREKEAFNYSAKLKEKFAHHPNVKRISKHRHVPRAIYSAKKELQTIKHSQKRKEMNRRLHSTPGSVPFVPEAKKHVVGEKE